MRFSIDPVTGAKACTLTVQPILYDGIPWGPVVSYLWSGDIGYWIETVQVRQFDEFVHCLSVWLHRAFDSF